MYDETYAKFMMALILIGTVITFIIVTIAYENRPEEKIKVFKDEQIVYEDEGYVNVYKNQNTLTIQKTEDDGTTSTTVIPLNDSITYTIEKK